MASTMPQRARRVDGLLLAELAERRIGLALPAPVGVPLRLPVTDEQDAGHSGKVARAVARGSFGPPHPDARGNTMKAALCLEQDQPLSVEEVTPIDPGPGDVIVRITASGVCHSDLSVINGTLPAGRVVLGHEGTGVIEKVGSDVTGLAVGDRVIGSFIPACGVCWYCLHDQSNLCEHTYNVMFVPRVRRADGEEMVAMTGLGTFAELMTVQQMSVVKVETDLPDEQLALIGCGVTTGVGAALNTAQVEPGSIVAVIGCGGVGQAVIQGARIAGAARIIAIDPVALQARLGAHERGHARDRPDRRRPGRSR